MTAAQAGLREEIFGEIKGRTQETDLSVPVRKGGWWYYARTVEGKQYAVHCRCAVRPGQATPPRTDDGGPLPGEEILLDGNELAGGRAVLLARRVRRQPGRAAARLLDGLHRVGALHAADQGPDDRRARTGRDPGHPLRLRVVQGRFRAVLRHGRRGLAPLPGMAAPDGHPGRRGRDRPGGERRAVRGERRADPQRGLPAHRGVEQADERGLAAGRHRAGGRAPGGAAAAAGRRVRGGAPGRAGPGGGQWPGGPGGC